MNSILAYLTRNNVVLALVLIYVAVGVAKVLFGDLPLQNLVALMDVQIAALGLGAGLATVGFVRAQSGEQILGIAALLVLLYAAVGGGQVIAGDMTYEGYLKLMDLPVAGLAVGKGVFANNQ